MSVATVTPLRPVTTAPEWLSPADVAARVPGITVENLAELRKSGRGPRYRKPTGERGKVIIYSAADVDAWVEAGLIPTRDQR